ncbi:hypothetical protein PORY_001665 [Pneumocystis oryctolagi]|uniref:Uncharacterized protein n=1 Tax=Pneumocystis oryctolagi TaxID=42067 RepID=A0ACB7CD61_9ASCO|nr:hypothetical protein PORY_001665 [Pneumocystis oryctolagi]
MESYVENDSNKEKDKHANTNKDTDISQYFDFQEKVKLIFCKSKTYISKNLHINEKDFGYTILVEKISKQQLTKTIDIGNTSLLWVPNSIITSSDDYETYKSVEADNYNNSNNNKNTYITFYPLNSHKYIQFIPLLKIHSVLVKPPTENENDGFITINLYEKNNYLTLFFTDENYINSSLSSKLNSKRNSNLLYKKKRISWSGEYLLVQLESLNIKRSPTNRNVYLANTISTNIDIQSKDNINQKMSNIEKLESIKEETFKKRYKEIKWNILEHFSRITRFSREKTKDIFDISFTKKPLLSNLHPQLQKFLNSENTIDMMEEYDVARLYLARWAARIAEDSEKDRRNKIIQSKEDDWEKTSFCNFETLELDTFENNVELHQEPISEEQWKSWFDDDGKLSIAEEKKSSNLQSVHPNIRKEVWCFLLEIYPWNSTSEERKIIFSEKNENYIELKQKWWNNKERDTDNTFKDQKYRIEKDVHRTDKQTKYFTNDIVSNNAFDSCLLEENPHLETLKSILLTYNEYNKDLGYVQGMCDLLSPLYVVIKNEALSFWAFVSFMKRMQYNFFEDQSGMKKQLMILDQLIQLMDPKFYKYLENTSSTNLFFFFRMLLVWFKREFEWDDILQLWERLWTNHIIPQFHLFVALAILDKHKDIIIDYLRDFDEILKYMNDLSMTIDLESTLQRAKSLFYKFQQIIETIDANSLNEAISADYSKQKKINDSENNFNNFLSQNDKLPHVSNYLRELLDSSFSI